VHLVPTEPRAYTNQMEARRHTTSLVLTARPRDALHLPLLHV
jgi:hypothetical protein